MTATAGPGPGQRYRCIKFPFKANELDTKPHVHSSSAAAEDEEGLALANDTLPALPKLAPDFSCRPLDVR
jgi:hypothetical protein